MQHQIPPRPLRGIQVPGSIGIECTNVGDMRTRSITKGGMRRYGDAEGGRTSVAQMQKFLALTDRCVCVCVCSVLLTRETHV